VNIILDIYLLFLKTRMTDILLINRPRHRTHTNALISNT
jgi:hypothetical protein